MTFLSEAADKDIRSIDPKTVVAFRKHLASDVSGRTANFNLQVVKALFKDAWADGYLAANPAERVNPLKGESSKIVRCPFTIEEIKAILSVADPEWQSMIRFGLYTGQRLGDISTLLWSNVDLVRNEIRLTTRKTHKVLTVPIAAPLRDHILALRRPVASPC